MIDSDEQLCLRRMKNSSTDVGKGWDVEVGVTKARHSSSLQIILIFLIFINGDNTNFVSVLSIEQTYQEALSITSDSKVAKIHVKYNMTHYKILLLFNKYLLT